MADADLIRAAEEFLAQAKAFDGGYLARKHLVNQADKLRFLSESPMDNILRQWDTVHYTNSLNILRSRGVFEAIPEQGSITLRELSDATDTEETILARSLRCVIVQGVVEETAPNVYAHNAKSLVYKTTPSAYFFDILLDQDFAFKALPRYLETHDRKDVYDLKKSPYAYAHGMEGSTYYEVISADPKRLNMFNQTMVQMAETAPILGMFPFASMKAQVEAEPERPFLVDIGGNRGAVTQTILQEAPNGFGAPCILQDRPDVLSEDALPQASIGNIQKMEHDFFQPQPVKNAHLYLYRRILHDFYPDVCVQLCKNVASAMGPTSRLLIGDMVVPERPKLGDDMFCYWMDLSMLMLTGQEKTESQFADILDQAGLELVKVWRLPGGGPEGVVEAKLKSQTNGHQENGSAT